jgi:hypothetical protein
MPNADFVPPGDNNLLALAETLLAKLTVNPASHGLSVEKVAELEARKADFRTRKAAVAEITTKAKGMRAEKDKSGAALAALIREIARLVKGHLGYTEAEGKELGIVGHQVGFDPATIKPILSGTDKTGGMAVIHFVKGPSEGVNMYCQREGDADWVLIGRANHSPFIDNRPLLQPGKAELRRYTTVYVIHDQEIGQFSNIFELSCAP